MSTQQSVVSNWQRLTSWLLFLIISAGLLSCNSASRQPIKKPLNKNNTAVKQAQQTYQYAKVQQQEQTLPFTPEPYDQGSDAYVNWLTQYPYRKQKVAEYQRYLANQAGYVPPMEQMLRSARSWEKCGFEPYEVPPEHYWAEMVQTLQLVKVLKDQGLLPVPFRIVSVYRNPELNRCANGSKGSKHLMNAAVDIRIDYMDEFQRANTEYALCEFWNTQGDFYNFGLGLYRSGTIHIDTQGYRRWGSSYGRSSSPCHS